jgi:ectoine hydroxylase
MRDALPPVLADDSSRRVVEKDGGVIRSVYGSHEINDVFQRLTRHPRILNPATQILGSDAYVYQFKINVKAGFGGDVWRWHQDFIFWHNEDGMPSPRVTSVAVYLDDMTEFNGPLFLIPDSHRQGMIDASAPSADGEGSALGRAYKNSPSWISNLTADLKYSLNKETVSRLVRKNGIVSAKGPAGSALFFHGNTVHGSSNNISPFDRVVAIVTFNSTENVPVPVEEPRPEFLVSRHPAPVLPLSDDSFLC